MRKADIDLPINDDGSNIANFRNEIREFLIGSKSYLSSFWGEKLLNDYKGVNPIAEQIRLIEELEKNGCNVYLSAGNDGTGYVNLLSFAQGITLTGATENGKIPDYSSENSLVTRHAEGALKVRYIIDESNNQVEFDAFADKKVDGMSPIWIYGGPNLASEEDSQNFVNELIKYSDPESKIDEIKSSKWSELTDREQLLFIRLGFIYSKDQLIKLLDNSSASKDRKTSCTNFINKFNQQDLIYPADEEAIIERENNKVILTTEWHGTSFASSRQLAIEEFN